MGFSSWLPHPHRTKGKTPSRRTDLKGPARLPGNSSPDESVSRNPSRTSVTTPLNRSRDKAGLTGLRPPVGSSGNERRRSPTGASLNLGKLLDY